MIMLNRFQASDVFSLRWTLLTLMFTFTSVAFAQQSLSECQQQFVNQMVALGQNSTGQAFYKFIDPDSPSAVCTKAVCQGDYEKCKPVGGSGIKENLILVFSDEFEQEGRKFGVKERDPRWTAEDLYYFPTQDLEVYKPEQVTTWKGKAIITIDRAAKPESAISMQPSGEKWKVPKNFKSGMMNTWNKWCFTGGYLEMDVKLPGKHNIPGFWPAFWAMGNLGRAGYMPSTGGLWPYSFNTCGAGSSLATAVNGSKVPSQILPACILNSTDPNYVNRSMYGMKTGVARNAPEFDVFEIAIDRAGGAHASQTLQMAPLLPEGQSWADLEYYRQKGIPDGVQYPGSLSHLNTNFNGWSGLYFRPGNAYQDSMSAISLLNSSFYEGYHKFAVDWAPGEYLRWYVDDIFAYEINTNALLAREGVRPDGTPYEIAERLIPYEPTYLIFNLGMSLDFGEVDIDNLEFPSWMMIESLRVYQRAGNLSVGCSPPDMPTAQWINCHKEKYATSKDDDILFGECNGAQGRSALLAAVVAAAAVLFLS